MLKEALEFLSGKFSKSESAKLLSIPGDGRTAFIDQGGAIHEVPVVPDLRSHTVKSVDDLCHAAGKWNKAPVVWISDAAIVLLPDDADRRDRVSLPLIYSAAFQRLLSLAKAPVLDQLSLIRTLRIDLQGTVGRADLLTAVRQIKFKTHESGASSITHGNESMGRTIEAEVTGAGNIPDSVLVSCAVYSNHGESEERFTVACDLEIDVKEQKFRFRPIPDEIERVTFQALEGIRGRIAEQLDGVSLFYGSP